MNAIVSMAAHDRCAASAEGKPMNCVILYRINGGTVEGVLDDDGGLREFNSHDEALLWFDRSKLSDMAAAGQADYQVVELDEL